MTPGARRAGTPPRWIDGCPILHVDMDAFYASVATPGPARAARTCRSSSAAAPRRGALGQLRSPAATASARRCRRPGPAGCARTRWCSPPDFDALSRVSAAVMENFRRVTPLVEALSLDEAFLDVRGSARRLGSPLEIAEQLRATIHDEQGITCSVGVAASVSVAKLASRRAKPDGVLVVPPEEIDLVPAPARRGRAVGGGGEDPGDAAPARPGHRRRRRAHPAAHPPARGRRRRSAATCTSWPGAPTAG